MVYSDIAKLRLLNRKVKADFLEAARTSIELELAKVPVPITYDIALASYRNCVNRKYPPGDNPKITRRQNEVTTHGQGRGNYNLNNGGRRKGRGGF